VPEGDTVWRSAKNLDQTLTGRVLTRTDFRVPAFATLDLSGQTVTSTVSRGKHILTRIGTEHTLHTHLKMEGSWHLYKPTTSWRRPIHDARVVLHTEEWTAVGFALGITEVIATADEDEAVGHLGPDLLGPDWDEDEAIRRLARDPERTIGEALLDQRNLAGVGNMYMAELCFISGVRPDSTVAEVPDLRRMVRRAKQVLEVNKERVQQTTTGDLRRGKQLYVYARGRQPCHRCRTRVESTMLGVPPRDRITYWCPTCQPVR
jgi:endonuclease-8